MTYTEWYTRSRSNEFRAKLKILVSRFIISPSFLFSFSSFLSPLFSLSLRIKSKHYNEDRNRGETFKKVARMVPCGNSTCIFRNGRSTQIFRFWFNKIFLAPSEKRIDSRSDRFFFFFLPFIHHCAPNMLLVHECIWFWIVHQFYFNIYTLLFTQAAGSHEHSMVRASGTRPERFLSRS